jgi:hypothetical protein
MKWLLPLKLLLQKLQVEQWLSLTGHKSNN